MIRCDWLSDEFQREYDRSMVYDLSDPLPELPELPGQVEVCPDADVAAERLLTDFRHWQIAVSGPLVIFMSRCRVTRALRVVPSLVGGYTVPHVSQAQDASLDARCVRGQ